ncbi:hypothetical protein BYT27DRAFT_7062848, partial [Phlegmacium glaucopus]
PTPFIDQDNRVFLVLAGRPSDQGYVDAADAAYQLLAKEGIGANFAFDQVSHRRGRFPALNVGVTHGNGTLQPTYLDNRTN